MTSKLYYELQKAIKAGTFKLIRLVRYKEGSEHPEVIVEYNSVSGGMQGALDRLDTIRMKTTKILPNGSYKVQCRESIQNKKIVEEDVIATIAARYHLELQAAAEAHDGWLSNVHSPLPQDDPVEEKLTPVCEQAPGTAQ